MKLDRTSMLYGTLVLTLTSIVSQFLGFVYRIFLSRLIGAEVMGLYQLIMPVGIQINHAGASAQSARTNMQPVSASNIPSKAGGEIPRPLE